MAAADLEPVYVLRYSSILIVRLVGTDALAAG